MSSQDERQDFGFPVPVRADTKRSSNVYIREAARYKLLTAEEEVLLARRIRAGDKRAASMLVTSNLRLVVRIASKYRDLAFEDAIQEGNRGLMRAVHRFDPDKGWRFSTYATWWIKQALTRALDNTVRTIRVPVHLSALARKIETAVRRNPDMSTAEVAALLKMSEKKMLSVMAETQHAFSLDAPALKDGTMGSLVANDRSADPFDEVCHRDTARAIREWVGVLEGRQRLVIELRFGLKNGVAMTLEQVGKEIGVSREYVRQLEVKALDNMRRYLGRYGDLAPLWVGESRLRRPTDGG